MYYIILCSYKIKEHETCTQYSGVENNGKNVMGILKFKPKNKRFEIDNILKWNINSEWTFQEAAKLPLAYSMVNTYIFLLSSYYS